MFKTIRFAAVAAAATLLAAPALAQSSPALGNWDTEAVTDFGTFKATLTIAESGGGYSVQMADVPQTGPDGQPAPVPASTISDVVVDGAKLTFKRKLTTPQGEMNLTYTANVSGDALTGEVGSDFGPIPLTGTRK